METLSALVTLCDGNPTITQRDSDVGFDVFFDINTASGQEIHGQIQIYLVIN